MPVTTPPEWWIKPRRISVVVDNPSWVFPFAERLVEDICKDEDEAVICRSHKDIQKGAVAFYLGCTTITPAAVLSRNVLNLIIHGSNLPRGRGFSPMTWLTLEGSKTIPVCLLEAANKVDSGVVFYRDEIVFQGHELIEEMREALGQKTMALCRRLLDETVPPKGIPQEGKSSCYPRRYPENSALNPERPLSEQFDLLRTVDNVKYPAFFDYRGHRYLLTIRKSEKNNGSA